MSISGGQGDAVSEQVLIEKARAGDGVALESLLEMHQDRVFRTALGLVGGDEEAALEVAQEVLTSAWKHFAQFRGASKFSTWLYRMTVNFSKNRAIAQGRRAARFVSMETTVDHADPEAPQRDFADAAQSPRDQLAGQEMLQIVFARIGQLPEDFRTVMVLRYMEDRSYEEIADLLELPLGTVKSRINRGRTELRRLMGDLLAGEGR